MERTTCQNLLAHLFCKNQHNFLSWHRGETPASSWLMDTGLAKLNRHLVSKKEKKKPELAWAPSLRPHLNRWERWVITLFASVDDSSVQRLVAPQPGTQGRWCENSPCSPLGRGVLDAVWGWHCWFLAGKQILHLALEPLGAAGVLPTKHLSPSPADGRTPTCISHTPLAFMWWKKGVTRTAEKVRGLWLSSLVC